MKITLKNQEETISRNRKEIQKALIEKAIKEHKNIKPCGNRPSLDDCFTYHADKIVLWFNVEEHTKVLVHRL
jgi:hypothetical protein